MLSQIWHNSCGSKACPRWRSQDSAHAGSEGSRHHRRSVSPGKPPDTRNNRPRNKRLARWLPEAPTPPNGVLLAAPVSCLFQLTIPARLCSQNSLVTLQGIGQQPGGQAILRIVGLGDCRWEIFCSGSLGSNGPEQLFIGTLGHGRHVQDTRCQQCGLGLRLGHAQQRHAAPLPSKWFCASISAFAAAREITEPRERRRLLVEGIPTQGSSRPPPGAPARHRPRRLPAPAGGAHRCSAARRK